MAWVDQSTLTDRNKAAAHLRSKGFTGREIGAAMGISAARSLQIVKGVELKFAARHRVAENRARKEALPWEMWTADDLEIGVRAYHVMRNRDLTLGDVAKTSDSELLRNPNCGRKTLKELRDAVAKAGGPMTPETERDAAMDMVQVFRNQINTGLLPEQVASIRAAKSMIAVCIAYSEGVKAGKGEP
jgi:DNA-binding CsgD family transcriptional regulator